MGNAVPAGAMCKCDKSTNPKGVSLISLGMVKIGVMSVATEKDFMPVANIPFFGFLMCNSQSHPGYAAAQATGALPPCAYAPAGTWTKTSPSVEIGGMKVLNDSSELKCMWGGTITIGSGAAKKVQVP